MNLQELFAELRKHRVSVAQVVGEMGWKPEDVVRGLGVKLEDVAPVVAGEQWSRLQAAEKAIGEMAKLMGLSEAAPDKVLERVKQALEASRRPARSSASSCWTRSSARWSRPRPSAR